MNNIIFLLESLKRNIKDLGEKLPLLSIEQRQELKNMTTKKQFNELFGIDIPLPQQLGERELSELANYQFNTITVGLGLLKGSGGITCSGCVCHVGDMPLTGHTF